MIEFRSVDFRYPDSSGNVLERLSFRIPDHGITAIMGANGSGKSTAALCMNATLVPGAGEVIVNGLSTRDKGNKSAVRKTVGVVFQDPNRQFTSLTVERELAFGLENIGMQRQEMSERVGHFLRLFNLEQYRMTAPASLSGGEKQRVALASVAIMNPGYLVLDEATSLLAPAARQSILRHVNLVAGEQGCAAVLITQFPQEAMLADRLVIFQKGRVEREGPPGEIFRDGAGLKYLGIPVPLSARLGTDGY